MIPSHGPHDEFGFALFMAAALIAAAALLIGMNRVPP